MLILFFYKCINYTEPIMSCYTDLKIYTTTHNICVKRLVKHFKLLSATKDNSPIELIYFEKDNISTQEKETSLNMEPL